jgi:hypothetical protein
LLSVWQDACIYVYNLAEFFLPPYILFVFVQIQLAPEEYVKKLSGTVGGSGNRFVASLEIETNRTTYGPYGKESSDSPFSIPLPQNTRIVGFFGRAGTIVDAISVYLLSDDSTYATDDASQGTSTN